MHEEGKSDLMKCNVCKVYMSKQDSDHVAGGAQRRTDDSVCLCVYTHLHSVNPHTCLTDSKTVALSEVLQRDL